MSESDDNRIADFFEATDFGLYHGYPELNLWLRVFLDCFLELRDRRRSEFDQISAKKFLFGNHICFDLLAAALDLTPDELRARVKKALARNGSRTKKPRIGWS